MRAAHGYMKRNRKRDANEPGIIAILEYAGASVYPLDKPLDLLVGFRGETFLIEVKNPAGANRIEPDQKLFFEKWLGRAARIVRTEFDALEAIGIPGDVAKTLIRLQEQSQQEKQKKYKK